ncbi:hypothetical protein P3T36_000228 [Kitasatospora sp. MAP12-15]|uniref:hypothetical protein n=1 Tax=unclassified Kitasatospora TaxID=2633591 RepID=UPI002473DF11|nr:hypothetical protein [Kitasatospora sp. MAP12-44]MDH6109457.1 hypothetical protein [Kitasatospora sp. MAP12-44]
MNETPEIGAVVVDTRSEKLAVVTDVDDGRLTLREPGGGMRGEWEAVRQHLRPADPAETLRAHVAEANTTIRRELGIP